MFKTLIRHKNLLKTFKNAFPDAQIDTDKNVTKGSKKVYDIAFLSAFQILAQSWSPPVIAKKILAMSGQQTYLDQVKKLGCADETILKDDLLSMDGNGYKTLTDIGKEKVRIFLNLK